MPRSGRSTISGLNLKNFRTSWKALKKSARKAKRGFSGRQRSREGSRNGKRRLQIKFPTKGLLGTVSTEVRTQERSRSKIWVIIGRRSMRRSDTNPKDFWKKLETP